MISATVGSDISVLRGNSYRSIDMIPLHEQLKQIRLNQGVTLEDIHRLTKIRIELLEKIEDGDYSVVPKPYLRAFLREYADVTGINPDNVLDVLDNKSQFIIPQSEKESHPPDDSANEPDETITEPVTGKDTTIESGDSGGKTDDDSEMDTPVMDDVTEEAVTESDDVDQPSEPESPVGEKDTTEKEDIDVEHTSDSLGEDTDATTPPPETEKQVTDIPDETDRTIKKKRKSKRRSRQKTAPEKPAEPDEASIRPEESVPAQEPVSEPSGGKPLPQETGMETQPRKRLDIVDPGSSGTLFFVMFLLLLIISAAVIVWMNRSGMF